MSGCKHCGKPTRASERTGRPVKYCSKKCANDFHYSKNFKRREGWGEGTRKKKEQHQKNIEQFQWYSENWLTAGQVAELLGLETKSAVHHRSKAMGVEWKVIPIGNVGGCKSFWNPDDIDKLIPKETPIPEGYLTRKQAADHLGIARSTFISYNKDNLPSIDWRETHGTKSLRKLYKPDDLDRWNKELIEKRAQEAEERKQIRRKQAEERKAIREQKRIAEQEVQRKLREQKIKEETQGLISREGVIALLGVTTWYFNNHLSPIKKLGGKSWYDPADVERLKLKREEEANRERFPNLVLKEGDPTEAYENKLFKTRIPNYIAKGTFISNRTGQLKDHFVDAVANNKKWHNNRINLGLVKRFTCQTCLELLPYTSFSFVPTSHGRIKRCKKCETKRAMANYNPELQKEKRKKNYVQKIRSIVGVTIKKKISKWRKSYADEITIPMIWEHIEENLGYDAAALCDHLESQFDDWMSWENHGRGIDKIYWQIDHIKPQSKFVYTSLDDPDFLLCWELSNLRPLEQVENIGRQI